jgi:hypothetical protein
MFRIGFFLKLNSLAVQKYNKIILFNGVFLLQYEKNNLFLHKKDKNVQQ